MIVTGFDPLVSEVQIRHLFSSFGEIAEIKNQIHKTTGSYLGVCMIRYRDSKSLRAGPARTATEAARKAHEECKKGQHRIGERRVRATLDRDGTVLRKSKAWAEEQLGLDPQKDVKPVEPARDAIRPSIPGPPPTAPKGPSGRSSRPLVPPPPPPPTADLQQHPPREEPYHTIELRPILEQIKREPYIFIDHHHVPVMAATVGHLRNRLKRYDINQVRCDRSGYYIFFADSKRGEEEAVRCYQDCHKLPLFTYSMVMECQQYGNPSYERSPSPQRILDEKRKKAKQEQAQKEAALDLEEEKKQRALNLDPVVEMVDIIHQEVKAKLLEDVKARIVPKALRDYLDSDRHIEKRRRLNVIEPRAHGDLTSHASSSAKANNFSMSAQQSILSSIRQPLGPGSLNVTALPRIRKGEAGRENSGFTDERRRVKPVRKPAPKANFRLHHFQYDADSDDDHRTMATRETEDLESRPPSRMSVTSVEDDSQLKIATPKKPRKSAREMSWIDVDSQRDESPAITPIERTDSADRESVALSEDFEEHPPKPTKRKRLVQELAARKKKKRDDHVNMGVNEQTAEASPLIKSESSFLDDHVVHKEAIAEDLLENVDRTPDPSQDIYTETTITEAKVKKPAKGRKKSKKQIFEERQALEEAAAEAAEIPFGVPEVADIVLTPEAELEMGDREIPKQQVSQDIHWGTSVDYPRRTVEDDPDLVLDLDGWQHLTKDDEDHSLLREALSEASSAAIKNPFVWAWRQKEIRSLNRGERHGPVFSSTHVEGYYVPNPSGCARTEGYKKISQVEKSKYLPHRVKVLEAREKAKARAELDPITAAAEKAKMDKLKKDSKSTSRSNRVNHRRLAADMAATGTRGVAGKEALTTDSNEGNALRFNQLKKRAKHVRFDRSPIHNWGLFAEEPIAANDMIIEYVGEKIRQAVADRREVAYTKQGIGSSYLFRLDDYYLIDATKKGGIARFINHSCMPNCTAKIIRVEGTRRIVIYALRDIEARKISLLPYSDEC